MLMSLKLRGFPELACWFSFAALASAQPWAGVVAPSRAIDWSQAGVQGGIPSATWTQCGATIQPIGYPLGTSTGPADPKPIEDQIQACGNAYNAAPTSTPGYVLLGPGNFYLCRPIRFDTATSGSPLMRSNVVLRGSGANQTQLYFWGYQGSPSATANTCPTLPTLPNCATLSAICAGGYGAQYNGSPSVLPGGTNAADWNGTQEGGNKVYPRGASHLSLALSAGTVGLAVGEILILDEDSDEVFIQHVTESGTTVTATATGPLPRQFVTGAKILVSGVGCGGGSNGSSNAGAATGSGDYGYNVVSGAATLLSVVTGTGYPGSALPAGVMGGYGAPGSFTYTAAAQPASPLPDCDPGQNPMAINSIQTFPAGCAPSPNPTPCTTTLVTMAAGSLDPRFANGSNFYVTTTCEGGTCSTTKPSFANWHANLNSHYTMTNVNAQAGTFNLTTSFLCAGCAYSQTATGGQLYFEGGVAVADNGADITCNVTNLCGYKGAQISSDGNTIGRQTYTYNSANPQYEGGQRRQIMFPVVITATPCGSLPPGQTCKTNGYYTISPPLPMDFSNSVDPPGAWWITPQFQNVGVENLTVDTDNANGAIPSNSAPYTSIGFDGCNGCWVQGVRFEHTGRNGVWIYQSVHVTAQNNFFWSAHGGGGSVSYGVEPYIGALSLFQNNIFERISGPTVVAPNYGNVYGYNYSINNLNVGTYMFHAFWDVHDNQFFTLYEGNVVSGIRSDSTFENGLFGTFFRNFLSGADFGPATANATTNTAKTAQTYPIGLEAWNRFYNVVGNVLGNPFSTGGGTVQTYYQCLGLPSCGNTNADQSIYVLGVAGGRAGPACFDPGQCPSDASVASTLMRWGNWDTVCGPTSQGSGCNGPPGAQWNASEVPYSGNPNGGGVFFSNPVPSNHILAASWYLPGQPSWWVFPNGANAPFPAIGPDVTGGNAPPTGGIPSPAPPAMGGHAWVIPAMNCYLNVMGGARYGDDNSQPPAAGFDPQACYVQAQAPVSGGVFVTGPVRIIGPVVIH